jgi:riboflavin kinase / FMN adenylyltransferase
MRIHQGYENLNLTSPVVTLGIFDGVHRGHKYLLDKLLEYSRKGQDESVIITFDPHPRIVLQQNHKDLSFLSTFEEKVSLLRAAGIDHLIVIDFNKDFSNLEACEFVHKILHEKIRTKHLIVGHDHHFGKRGKGNFDIVRNCAESLNIIVEQVPGFHFSGTIVSSTVIRELLLTGRLDEANDLLGYSYSLSGKIVQGKKIGRSIGFPTANIKLHNEYKLVPADGVYAVMVGLDKAVFPGMLSIGTNPTIRRASAERTIEVHILNFDRDIYGKDITVTFRKRLRDEMRFENMEQLAFQMSLDKQETLNLLT